MLIEPRSGSTKSVGIEPSFEPHHRVLDIWLSQTTSPPRLYLHCPLIRVLCLVTLPGPPAKSSGPREIVWRVPEWCLGDPCMVAKIPGWVTAFRSVFQYDRNQNLHVLNHFTTFFLVLLHTSNASGLSQRPISTALAQLPASSVFWQLKWLKHDQLGYEINGNILFSKWFDSPERGCLSSDSFPGSQSFSKAPGLGSVLSRSDYAHIYDELPSCLRRRRRPLGHKCWANSRANNGIHGIRSSPAEWFILDFNASFAFGFLLCTWQRWNLLFSGLDDAVSIGSRKINGFHW